MPRYVALLRGVSPTNARMPDLVRSLQAAGFGEVETVLSSGNVLFTSPKTNAAALERRCEDAFEATIGRRFPAIVRAVDDLLALLADDPFRSFRLAPASKRVVTFLRQPPSEPPPLPIEEDGARILALRGSEAFTAYVVHPKGPVFMRLLEKTFGKDVTTRTWDTVAKIARRA